MSDHDAYLLSLDNLNASAVLITSTYACSSNRRDVTFKLWFSIANLNADCTSSVPCSKIAPAEKEREKKRKVKKKTGENYVVINVHIVCSTDSRSNRKKRKTKKKRKQETPLMDVISYIWCYFVNVHTCEPPLWPPEDKKKKNEKDSNEK